MTNALTIIHWKHQTIASVLHAICYVVDQMWADRQASARKRLRRFCLRSGWRGSGARGSASASPLSAASVSLPG